MIRNMQFLSCEASFEMIARSVSSTPVHACSSSFNKGQCPSILLWSELDVQFLCF